MLFRVLLCSLVFASACRSNERKTDAGIAADTVGQAAIREVLKRYYDDMSRRDWQAYRSYFWEHATITTVWRQPGDSVSSVDVTTIDDFILETPNGPDSAPVFEERMTNSRIETKGSIAIAWATYTAAFGKPDSLMRWTGTDVFTFLNHDNKWKIVSLTFEADE